MFKFVLRLSDEEGDLLKGAAVADSRSINSWCKLTLLRAIEGISNQTKVKVNVQPGEDIIVQRRNKSGKFVKRGE
jgi:hypothetical protein